MPEGEQARAKRPPMRGTTWGFPLISRVEDPP
jgi:hypothetical protein